jgi:hypothetical protein
MMQNLTMKIHNAETDEIIERELNAEELNEIQNHLAQKEINEQAALDLAALKASAKAKLIAGEPLTAAEADTLVI